MQSKKLFVFAALLIVASMLLAACQPAAAPAEAVAEKKVLNLNMGPGDIPTLDPALATDTSSNQIIELITVGLTRQNEVTTDVEPGMATSWSMADDGVTYTFTLREDVPWVKYDAVSGEVVQVMDCEGNPRMVTAQDFVYGMLRTLAPATASDYAYVLAFALKGGADYNAGTLVDVATGEVIEDPETFEGESAPIGPEVVAVKAIDNKTVEMTFNEPAVFNLNIAGMWVAHAMPAFQIDGDDCTEGKGDRWTETGFNVSYGPYALKEWVHDSYITLVKNPFWPGQDNIPQPKIDEITWKMLDEVPAYSEYEAGTLDIAAVPLADIDRVKADPTLSKELVIAPDLCTYYYGFNTTAPVVDDVRVRRALSFAVDRQSLIDNVTKGGQEPAGWFSRPGLAGAPTREEYPDLGAKFDPEYAKAQLQEYLDEKGQTVADLDISLMFNTSSGHQKIAEAIQAMWKENLGLDVKLVNQEWKVYLETIKGEATPQIWRLGWCQDYPDANNFIREVFAVGGSANTAKDGVPIGGVTWKNDKFEKGVLDAARELDPDKRTQMYAELEQLITVDDAIMIPLYWYTRVSTTKPYVERTFSVLGGLEHMEKWDIKK